MTETVWINGTERLLNDKTRFGMYQVLLDEEDVKWLNNLNNGGE